MSLKTMKRPLKIIAAFVVVAMAKEKLHHDHYHHHHHHLHLARNDKFMESTTHSQFKHSLRVCNAYPSSEPLELFRRHDEKLTGDDPLPYKGCRDFGFQLRVGDGLVFKSHGNLAGIFQISDLPNSDALLMLVIYRHDTLTNAVGFKSHVFANLMNSQVAVIDAYTGLEHSAPVIRENNGRGEEQNLKYNSVVALRKGNYEVSLKRDGQVVKFAALNRENYVVLRTGIQAQTGQSFPEELVVYPRFDASLMNVKAANSSGQISSLSKFLLVAFCIVVLAAIALFVAVKGHASTSAK